MSSPQSVKKKYDPHLSYTFYHPIPGAYHRNGDGGARLRVPYDGPKVAIRPDAITFLPPGMFLYVDFCT